MTTTRLLRSPHSAALIAAAVLIATSLGCGYHLTSKGSNLPSHIKTIGVPEFQNATTRPELGGRITENLREALIARGIRIAFAMPAITRATITPNIMLCVKLL